MKVFLLCFFVSFGAISLAAQSESENSKPAQNFVGNKYSKIYWPAECGERYTIPQKGYISFKDEAEAKEQGYARGEKCTLLDDSKETKTPAEKIIQFIGDKQTKIFYALTCAEISTVKPENNISFFTKEEAEEKGFKSGDKCSKPEPPKVSLPAEPKLGKTGKAYNILQILSYPENWTDRQIIIKGRIKLASLPERNAEKKRIGQAFRIYDNSGSILVLAPESEGTKKLRDIIIANDGDPVPGTFTFIIPKGLSKQLNDLDILNETIGQLTQFIVN